MPEVCVTGLGSVTPLGLTAQTTWTNLLQARTAVRLVKLDPQTTELAAPVTAFPQPPHLTNEDRSVQFALTAARQAMADAGLSISNRVQRPGGAVIGSSKRGILSLLAAHARWLAFRHRPRPRHRPRRPRPSRPPRRPALPHRRPVPSCRRRLRHRPPRRHPRGPTDRRRATPTSSSPEPPTPPYTPCSGPP